jgi:hypothetical protein
MTNTSFIRESGQRFFNGALSPAVVERLEALPSRDDARGFLERGFELMKRGGLPPQDLSPFQAELFASIAANLLPGCWGGRVPPITLAGRHVRLDQLVKHLCGTSGRMLDIACGFPPLTTIDSASALPGWTVMGVDRSLPEFLVHDSDGNYCVYDERGQALYFQPLVPTTDSWEALLGNAAASTRRFETTLASLRAVREQQPGKPHVLEHDGLRLSVHPVNEYESPNLSFLRSDLESLATDPAHVVRCFNMLMYFDDRFREAAMEWFAALLHEDGLLLCGTDWAWSTEARYSLYRKRGGIMQPIEFAFTLDNLAPIGVATYYTLHSDEREANMLASLCAILRADRSFNQEFTRRYDELRLEYGLCPRQPDGYVSGTLPIDNPAAMWITASDCSRALDASLAGHACRVLSGAGYTARVNEIGNVAIAL